MEWKLGLRCGGSRIQHDSQSTFLDVPADEILLRLANHISSSTDPRLPRCLEEADWAEIHEKSRKLGNLEDVVPKVSRKYI
jgi:hypothetical protein